jgi:hypothetical protein
MRNLRLSKVDRSGDNCIKNIVYYLQLPRTGLGVLVTPCNRGLVELIMRQEGGFVSKEVENQSSRLWAWKLSLVFWFLVLK